MCEREENEALLSPREHFRLLRVLLHRLRLHPPASVCSIQDFSHLSTQPASARPREGCLLPSGAFSVAAAVYNLHLSLSLSLPLAKLKFSPRLCLMKYKGRSQQTEPEKSIRIKGKETRIKKERKLCCIPANPFLIHFHPVLLFLSDEVKAKSVGPLCEIRMNIRDSNHFGSHSLSLSLSLFFLSCPSVLGLHR